MITIPFYQDKSSKFQMQIDLDDNNAFTLDFFWNSRESAWYMTILDSLAQTLILSGIRLTAEYSLLKQYKGLPNMPKGDFFITDEEDKQYGIDFDNIGIGLRFQMFYLTREEVNGL